MNIIEFYPSDVDSLAKFGAVAQQVYAHDPVWVSQSEAMVPGYLTTNDGHYVQPLVCIRAGTPVARAAAILHPRAVDGRGRPLGYIGLFECLEQCPEAGQAVLGHAERLLRARGVEAVEAPRVDNMLMGLLLEGFDLPHTILTPHNPPYYRQLLLSQGYCLKERLFTYLFERPAALRLPLALPDFRMRTFDRRQLDREVEIFHRLEHEIFASHPGWVGRSLEEDRQLIHGFLPLLDDDLVIIAETREEQPVGLLICLPDVYQACRGQPINRARLFNGGAVPAFAGKGLGVLMCLHLARNLAAKGYHTVEASWIRDINLSPQNVARRFAGRRGREFGVFEKNLAGAPQAGSLL